MSVRFICPCGRALKAPDERAGHRVKCPGCERILRVPAAPKVESGDILASLGIAAKEGEAEAGGIPMAERPTKTEDSRGHVLLAEPSKSVRAQEREMLEAHGYRVTEASDGNEALEKVRQLCPDVLMVDVRLPSMNGFQVVQALRDPNNPRNAECWQTPAILTADKVRGRDKQYAISLGVGGYFEKPLVPAKLFRRIEKLLEKQSHRPEG